MRKHAGSILLFLTALLLGMAITRFHPGKLQKKTQPKNLIILSIDTLRQDGLGVNGNSKNLTPNIDKWAKKSTTFTNVYTEVPMSYASFAALMTGLSPFDSGIYNNASSSNFKPGKISGNAPIDADTTTLAQILQENNYTTKAVVLNPVLSPKITNLDRGFDEYKIVNSKAKPNQNEVLYNQVMDWFDDLTPDKPFFIWAHFLDPHSPYLPDPEFSCKFNDRYCDQIKETGLDKLEEKRKNLEACHDKPIDQETINMYKTLYEGEVATVDNYVGKILGKIKKRGLDKNSVIVIYGDHGESFGKGQEYFHHGFTVYEQSVKIPLIIYSPDGNLNRKSDQFINNTDIFPTLLELIHITNPVRQRDTYDFSKLIKANSKMSNYRSNELFYTNLATSKYAVRKGSYKYIMSEKNYPCDGPQAEELYNLSTDPDESKNLVNDDRETARALHTRLLEYIAQHPIGRGKKVIQEQIQAESSDSKPNKDQDLIDELKSLGY